MGAGAAAGAPDPTTASWPPISTVSSSCALISSRIPATGDGISVSTLSVETSSSASSTATSSPTALSQRVTVPSVTDSPRAGIVTAVPSAEPPEAAGASAAGASSAGASAAGASSAGASSAAGAGASASGAAASPASPIWASSPPISTVSSSCATILVRTPATGDGISVSTLSVETSSKGSSTSTVSPSCLSHRVTVPSVTLSPRAGIWTEKAMSFDSSTVVFGLLNFVDLWS